jgi:hypothetical protein
MAQTDLEALIPRVVQSATDQSVKMRYPSPLGRDHVVSYISTK